MFYQLWRGCVTRPMTTFTNYVIEFYLYHRVVYRLTSVEGIVVGVILIPVIFSTITHSPVVAVTVVLLTLIFAMLLMYARMRYELFIDACEHHSRCEQFFDCVSIDRAYWARLRMLDLEAARKIKLSPKIRQEFYERCVMHLDVKFVENGYSRL